MKKRPEEPRGARAVFAEWLAKTGDVRIAAERAGVSERTGRRWKAGAPSAEGIAPQQPYAEPTKFVGRKAALLSLRKLLSEGARIVTVLGPAGIGKTRIVLRYADLNASAYPGGVLFCDVSGARTVEGVCAAVAGVLGVTPSSRASDGERAEQLGHALESRGAVLLVLDNFEQAVGAAPGTIGVWTAIARRAHVLVTSRMQLRVLGEACFWLDALDEADAVQLFVDRAQLARPGYELGDGGAAVGELVKKLDGNALAIELAAARVAMLSPKQLLARLSKRFDVLAGGARDAAERQASMRAALDQSWELLDDAGRRVLAQASLFRGGFTLDAAEAVIDAGGGGVLDALETLRQSSLVYTTVAPSGAMRFGMYETIRDYAAERLADAGGFWGTGAATARKDAARRFAEHFAVHADPGDVENLTQALALALDVLSDPSLALRAALASAPVLAGRAVAEVELLERALKHKGGDADLRLAARVALGVAHRKRGALAVADDELVGALADVRRTKKRALEAQALLALGAVHRMEGKTDAALGELESALPIAREVGDAALEARVLGDLAHVHRMRRDYEESTMALAERALELHRKLAAASPEARDAIARRDEADMCGLLASLHQARGESHQARSRYEEALDLLGGGGDLGVLAAVHTNLGTLLQELGSLDEALGHHEEALRLCVAAGVRRLEGGVLGNRASVLFEMGRLDEAREGFDRAVRVLHDVGDPVHEAFFQAQLAAVIATQGGADEAGSLFARAEKRFESSGRASEMWKLAFRLQRCHIDLARAAQAEAEGIVELASKLRDDVREQIGALPPETTDDIRIAARMLARALSAPPKQPEPKPTLGALTVSVDASSVWLPTTVRVSLEKRKPVRLLLLRLIEEHEKAPGHPLGVDDLLAAGWPGERVLRDAGASRVYVALGTLRKLGLRDVILSREGGYLLDPTVKIVVVTT
jgi:predicted ATPase/Tfp pilus assembly protein PilF